MLFLLKRSLWYIKQLFPLTYWSVYQEEDENGQWQGYFSIWKMWFGRVYNAVTVKIADNGFYRGGKLPKDFDGKIHQTLEDMSKYC